MCAVLHEAQGFAFDEVFPDRSVALGHCDGAVAEAPPRVSGACSRFSLPAGQAYLDFEPSTRGIARHDRATVSGDSPLGDRET